tara:strand:+ start:1975 stop:2631 length:657 start_codon:yes stop_codon:yes gene_type:complete
MIKFIIDLLVDDLTRSFIIRSILSVFFGAFISFSLIKSGQIWAKSFSNVTTYCILPLIGLVITNVISGNIALSLGMVGALSVIRFRHPVKSPLELSIYFLLLTIGITLNTNIGQALLLALFSMSIVYCYALYKRTRYRNFSNAPDLSLNREEPQYLLEINCYKQESLLADSTFLIFSQESNDDNCIYKLAFDNRDSLEEFKQKIIKSSNIKEIIFNQI